MTYVGLRPHESGDRADDPARLARRYRIMDHGRAGGPAGLISVIGVKYTTARDVAEKTIGPILRQLGRSSAVMPRPASPLPGGEVGRFDDWRSRLLAARPHGLADDVLEQLAANYGTGCEGVLREIERDPSLKERVAPNTSVIRAEIIYAVREEMAQTLGDVVFRRTELGTLGHPGEAALEACAEIMARELHWDPARVAQELGTVRETFGRICPAVSVRAEVAA
jgi:glycerol-3-phosphate dehydrogenase